MSGVVVGGESGMQRAKSWGSNLPSAGDEDRDRRPSTAAEQSAKQSETGKLAVRHWTLLNVSMDTCY